MTHVGDIVSTVGGVQYRGVSQKGYQNLRVSIRKNIAALSVHHLFSLCLADWLLSQDAI